MKKKNKLLLISGALGLAYVVYLIVYIMGISTVNSSEALGKGIAVTIIMPHLVCVVLAVIFNFLGFINSHRGFTLTGAIVYAVSIALFIPYFMFVIVQMILSFVGFSQLKKEAQ